MDVFAHGLWSALIFKYLNFKKKAKKKFNVYLATFFGVFPDVLSFSFLFLWIISGLIFGNLNLSNLPHPDSIEPARTDTYFIYNLTNMIYNITHSLVIFLLVFIILFFIFKKYIWEIFGWLIHILIDIPSHSYAFYPTPFLWPISNWKFNGLSWANPKFMIVNYSAIAIVYLFLWVKFRINKT